MGQLTVGIRSAGPGMSGSIYGDEAVQRRENKGKFPLPQKERKRLDERRQNREQGASKKPQSGGKKK